MMLKTFRIGSNFQLVIGPTKLIHYIHVTIVLFLRYLIPEHLNKKLSIHGFILKQKKKTDGVPVDRPSKEEPTS